MGADGDNGDIGNNSGGNYDDLMRMLRDMLSGENGAGAPAFDPSELAKAAGLSGDPEQLNQLFASLRGAMSQPDTGVDWSIARKIALETASDSAGGGDTAPAERAFPVATIWLDEATELGATPDAPRTLSRIEWVQQTIDTWIGFAEPVVDFVLEALVGSLDQMAPEELADTIGRVGPVMKNVGGALFATQLGSVVGKLSGEVVSAGDIGIPLMSGPGREGGALLPAGVASFASGLDQDLETVTLYLAIRELAHARLFRHAKWLRLHLSSAIADYSRGFQLDIHHMEDVVGETNIEDPEEMQRLVTSGALLPPKTPEQEAAHDRIETILALIEGWVDVVTETAAARIPGADGIAEMMRRRRATGGPAEHAMTALVSLELRPRRLREASALWRLVEERGDRKVRDGLWAHPDLLPTSEEIDDPGRLLSRIGLTETPREDDDFDSALADLLDGKLPPHEGDETAESDEPPEQP